MALVVLYLQYMILDSYYSAVCNVSAEQVLFIALQQVFGPLMLVLIAWLEPVDYFSLFSVVICWLLRGICILVVLCVADTEQEENSLVE